MEEVQGQGQTGEMDESNEKECQADRSQSLINEKNKLRETTTPSPPLDTSDVPVPVYIFKRMETEPRPAHRLSPSADPTDQPSTSYAQSLSWPIDEVKTQFTKWHEDDEDEDDFYYDDDDDDDDSLHDYMTNNEDDFLEEVPFNNFLDSSSSDDEHLHLPPPPKRSRGQEPGSDDDPEEPGVNQQPQYTRDRHGWTRDLNKIHVNEFEGKQPYGPTMQRPVGDDPLAYFFSFFPLYLFKKIARWTNISGSSNPRFTKHTTPEEIKAWVAIRMIQGVHSNFNSEDDWSIRASLRNPKIAATMTRGRFNMLSEVIVCTNPTKGPQMIMGKKDHYMYMKTHPLYPLQLIWDTVTKLCLQNYNPEKELSLDEVMNRYKGSKAIKRFCMPLKPTKMGLKIYAVCEARSGYLLHMQVHSESGQKIKDISRQMMEPFFGRYHQLYCNKLYTSTALATELLDNKTYMCGAVKRSSKGLPDDFCIYPEVNPTRHRQMQLMNSTARGTIYARQQGQMTMVLWRDTKVVSFLSTLHQGYRDRATDFLSRNIREKGEKSMSKIRAPRHAIDYTKFKSGVHRADQLRAYHSCSRQSQAWWKKILYFLIDVARVNAWLCYKANIDGEPGIIPISHRIFTVNIAEALIAGFAEGSTSHQNISLQPVPAVNGPNHQCIRMPANKAKMCIQCRRIGNTTAKRHPVTTRTGCTTCNIHLCRGKCFLDFHSAD